MAGIGTVLPPGEEGTSFQDLLEQMTSIDNIDLIMVGQDPEAVYAGRTPAQIVETLHKVQFEKNHSPPGNEIDYETAGYDPDEDNDLMHCNPIICHPLEEFNEVADYILLTPDPLSDELMSKIERLSQYDRLNKTKLSSKFRILARAVSLDWLLIRETLAEGCRLGYAGLLSSISAMSVVYQIQHTKAFNNNIVTLGQLVDQFKLQSNIAKQQSEMDKSFGEDLTRQLNSFTKSVAELSEKIDNKTLELSRPSGRRPCHSTTPPTADSVSLPQSELPCDIELIPGSTYHSKNLKVEIGTNEDITLLPLNTRSHPLAELAQLKMSKAALMIILNQDQSVVLGKCTTNIGFSKKFNSCPIRDEKVKILQTLFGSAAYVPGQWLRK